jgi:hypothetical protein
MLATFRTLNASLVALFCTFSLVLAGPAVAAEPDLQVKVERVGDEIRSVASLFVRASQQRVWDVVTDYERAPTFVREVQMTKILSRSGDTLRVLQKNAFRFGPFTIPVETVKDVRLTEPTRTEARLVSGSVEKYDSRTEITTETGGTRLTYRSQVIPGSGFAAFVSESTIRHETEEYFKQVRDEILRREHLAATR